MTIDEMITKKKQYGLSYDYISEKSGVPVSTVQKVFSKTTPTPRRETLESLNKAFKEYLESNGDIYLDHEEDEENAEIGMVREGEVEYNSGTSAFALDQSVKTMDDYMNLPEGTRVELIDGQFYDMAAPTTIHQKISSLINTEFEVFVKTNKGKCVPFVAPTDVQLDRDDKTMVQPDVMVVCDRSKITKARIVGAPDLVIEILSESNWYTDIVIKHRKYKEAGVREYWVVMPEKQLVLVYNFDKKSGALDPIEYTFKDKIPVGIWDGKCEVDFNEIYENVSFLL